MNKWKFHFEQFQIVLCDVIKLYMASLKLTACNSHVSFHKWNIHLGQVHIIIGSFLTNCAVTESFAFLLARSQYPLLMSLRSAKSRGCYGIYSNFFIIYHISHLPECINKYMWGICSPERTCTWHRHYTVSNTSPILHKICCLQMLHGIWGELRRTYAKDLNVACSME